MENVDSKTTIPYDQGLAAHSIKYQYDPEYKKVVDLTEWQSKVDKPLYDASLEVIPGVTVVATRMVGKVLPKSNYFTVYHGTSPEGKASIIDTGLLTKYTGQEGTLTNDALGATTTKDLSKGLAFTTTSKWDAARYAASHDPKTGMRVDNTSPAIDQLKKFGRQVKAYTTDDGIVTMTLPNSMYKSEVVNPEAALLLSSKFKNTPSSDIPSKYKSLQKVPDSVSGVVNPVVAAAGFGKDKVFMADIPSMYVKGAKDYRVPSGTDSVSYYEMLVNREGLAAKLQDTDRKLTLAKKMAMHKLVNETLQNSSAAE